jgi:hypothetical protein
MKKFYFLLLFLAFLEASEKLELYKLDNSFLFENGIKTFDSLEENYLAYLRNIEQKRIFYKQANKNRKKLNINLFAQKIDFIYKQIELSKIEKNYLEKYIHSLEIAFDYFKNSLEDFDKLDLINLEVRLRIKDGSLLYEKLPPKLYIKNILNLKNSFYKKQTV